MKIKWHRCGLLFLGVLSMTWTSFKQLSDQKSLGGQESRWLWWIKERGDVQSSRHLAWLCALQLLLLRQVLIYLPGGRGRKRKKNHRVVRYLGGQDFLSLFGVAHHSTADGLAASYLHEYPGILGVRTFRYPRAFHSQSQYRRVHKNVINSFSIGMVS